jgi:hypothetical protein
MFPPTCISAGFDSFYLRSRLAIPAAQAAEIYAILHGIPYTLIGSATLRNKTAGLGRVA